MPIEKKYNYRGDINIGLYAISTNEYLVVPRDFKRKISSRRMQSKLE